MADCVLLLRPGMTAALPPALMSAAAAAAVLEAGYMLPELPRGLKLSDVSATEGTPLIRGHQIDVIHGYWIALTVQRHRSFYLGKIDAIDNAYLLHIP